ncbi:MAG: trypsin-like peptidase domain-containing protein [Planctomycetota bacterium]
MKLFTRIIRAACLAGLLATLATLPVCGQEPGVSHARDLSKAFRSAAGKVAPAVVTIIAQSNYSRMLDDEDGTVGSGVVIHASGLILTNSHVIDGASRVLVRLADGREYLAARKLQDEMSDVAILELDEVEELTAAKLGDSDQLDTGDWVIAIGSPFELETTVSAGIISGKNRSLRKIQRGKLLQTDAAINPGNSGGPLVNLEGEVIGINTAIASTSRGYQGIGFAIPSNQAKWVVRQLIEHGVVRRAYLGVNIADLTAGDAQRRGLPPMAGVLISNVKPNSPASRAGLMPDDVIVEFAGMRVRDARDLQGIVEQKAEGSSHPMKIIRDGLTSTLDVRVERLED